MNINAQIVDKALTNKFVSYSSKKQEELLQRLFVQIVPTRNNYPLSHFSLPLLTLFSLSSSSLSIHRYIYNTLSYEESRVSGCGRSEKKVHTLVYKVGE